MQIAQEHKVYISPVDIKAYDYMEQIKADLDKRDITYKVKESTTTLSISWWEPIITIEEEEDA